MRDARRAARRPRLPGVRDAPSRRAGDVGRPHGGGRPRPASVPVMRMPCGPFGGCAAARGVVERICRPPPDRGTNATRICATRPIDWRAAAETAEHAGSWHGKNPRAPLHARMKRAHARPARSRAWATDARTNLFTGCSGCPASRFLRNAAACLPAASPARHARAECARERLASLPGSADAEGGSRGVCLPARFRRRAPQACSSRVRSADS